MVRPEGRVVLRQVHAEHSMLGIVLYLMCDDVEATIDHLTSRGVACSKVEEAPWGLASTVRLPSGGAIGLYQPTHATAIGPAVA